MKKVVVLFPYPEPTQANVAATVGQKTFEIKDGELHAYNTDSGCLIIKHTATEQHKGSSNFVEAMKAASNFTVLAVFKEWIYWERIE